MAGKPAGKLAHKPADKSAHKRAREPAGQRWIAETLFERLGLRMMFAAGRTLAETRTAHQHLVLFEHRHLGRVLMLDGAVQLSARDEFIYHEMMSHVPILAHGRAREVLIVGGGDCGIAEEVLKHKSVRRVTQVEIDPTVVELAKTHFPDLAGPALADKRFDLVIADGRDFVASTPRRFDVVIVDSTDPQGPGRALFGQKFYAAVKRCLAPGGVLVTQNGVPFLQPGELVASIGHWRRLFADASCYVAAVPTYAGGHLAMGWASDDARLRRLSVRTIAERYRRAGRFTTRYWTPDVHVAAFALPRYIATLVDGAR
jgi:spermidine synthase